ncbi:MAG: hypothetical protein GTN80_06190 [Nitrososphaeria archaeon]|nr:hypothetical protein [Nitrososphaeria archaeon]NIQ33215.1 hypothetical protein [Nitrososphaeria archaeon]
MIYETILFEKVDGVSTITLNRPESLNAINFEMAQELLRATKECEGKEVRAVVIRGSGRAFCAGGDVKAMRETLPRQGEFLRRTAGILHELILALRALKKPVIASISGPAAGAGFSLALACDLRIASEKTSFNTAYVRIGLSPDGSGTYFLPKYVGLGKACELFFLGNTIDAKEAERLGLVNKVVPEDDLESTTMELARRLAEGPTLAIGQTKLLIDLSFTEALGSQLDKELENLVRCSETQDFVEGISAFFEKRRPTFQGM